MVKAFYDDYSVKTILDSYEVSSTLIENEGTNLFTVKYQETNPYDADEIISFTKTFTVEGYIPEGETYRVSFDSMGGSIVESIKGVAKGETITLPNPPTKEGFVFGGWYRDTSCRVPFTENSKVTKDMTLYAKWEEFQLIPYSLEASYIGEALNVNDTIPKESIRVIAQYNDNIARLVEDFTFTPDTILQEGINVITVSFEDLNASVVIETGVPGRKYTITFDSCGGNQVADIKDITWGDSVTLPTPTKKGAEFKGWYTSKEYTTQFTEKDLVTGDITLYAKWDGEGNTEITPTGTGKVTPTVTQSATLTVKPTVTPTVTPTATPTITPTAAITPSITPTDGAKATPTSGANVTPTGGAEDEDKKKVESITAEYLGEDVAIGAAIKKENILVTATYSDKSTEVVTEFTIAPETVNAAGKNVIVVKYKGKSATITVNGVETTPTPTGSAGTATTAPTSAAKATTSPSSSTQKGSSTSKSAEEVEANSRKVQDAINDILNKVKNGNSDASKEEIAAVMDALHEMTPRELSELDEETIRSLDEMILNLSNVEIIIENHIEDYQINENQVWGLALILTSSDILSGNKIEVILDVSEASMTSSIKSLLEQYAIIQEKTIFKALDLSVYKYVELPKTTREDDKRQIYETLLPVHFTLNIPMENQGEPYYCIIREHEEQVVAIPDSDSAEDTISFETNYFSIYAMGYGNTQAEEVPIEEGETVTADTPENTSNIGDNTNIETKTKQVSTLPFILAAIAVIALAIMVITIVIVKELNAKDEEEAKNVKNE